MELNYKIVYSKRRSIAVTIQDDNSVLVKSPIGVSKFKVEEFLFSKKNWIMKHLKQKAVQTEKIKELGKLGTREISLLKKRAKVIIPERVEYFAKIGGFSYNKIFIRLQKTRWGSCSFERNLNFNCLLVMMPPEVLDSVIIHELCHLQQMNHSKVFYSEIYKLMPEEQYKRCVKWLKENGGILIGRVF